MRYYVCASAVYPSKNPFPLFDEDVADRKGRMTPWLASRIVNGEEAEVEKEKSDLQPTR